LQEQLVQEVINGLLVTDVDARLKGLEGQRHVQLMGDAGATQDVVEGAFGAGEHDHHHSKA